MPALVPVKPKPIEPLGPLVKQEPAAPIVVPPAEVTVQVDNAAVAAAIEAQNTKLEKALGSLAAAVAKLEPSKSITITVTGRDSAGRIQSVNIKKE